MSTPSSGLPVPASKANASSPKVNAEDVELRPVQNGSPIPPLPLEDDIMQCARVGAIEHIQKMIESKKVDPKYADEQGITPLHWAAINNQYAVCKYLIEQGADVNKKGGDSGANPAMWAAQRCHLYIVNLLLQHGTDPLSQDSQGYNLLHLATIDGHALLAILLLHQNIPVDVPDPQGHTSLMWAGYKGWPALSDLLLKWGASVNATDDNGFTPLHWALVKGSKLCVERLIEYGADRFAKTNDGKTPATCANEMQTTRAFHRALEDQGYDYEGNPVLLPFGLSQITRDRSKISKFLFFYPFLILPITLYIVSNNSIYVGLPLSMAVFVALQWSAQKLANFGPPDFRSSIQKTPYLAGIFSATLFLLGFDFLTRVMPMTWRIAPFSTLLFAILYASTAYFYSLAMAEDPGFVPKLVSRNQQRDMIEELFSLWKFDEDNFCMQCMIRKPLRSKHCRRCGRCVAKQDHHCPWINNCVANNNIRHFFVYVISMELGIFVFVRLILTYLQALPEPTTTTCNVLSPAICTYILRDTWTVALTIWTCIQLVWVTMLVVIQSIQIAKNITTFETMKRHQHNDAPHLPTHRHHPAAHGHSHATASLNDSAAASNRLDPAPRRPDGYWTKFKRTIGLDVFLATAQDAKQGKLQQSRGNPFSRGIIGNCKDFWLDPAPLFGKRKNCEGYLGGEVVDYARMYEVPLRLRRGGGGMVYTQVNTGGDDDEV